MIKLLVILFYQPFFNLLVLTYELLVRYVGIEDMGVAVIVFTLCIRLLLLPLTLASHESEDAKREIGREYERIRRQFKDSEPLKYRKEKEKLVRQHSKTVKFEILNLSIQVGIALILWRIFSTGIKGKDLHLLYNFVPRPKQPFNLVFSGKIDLTRPSLLLSVLTSLLLFIAETLSLMFSPLPPSRRERLIQLLLPLIVFAYLYTMPAGKKLFLVTTLMVTIFIMLLRETKRVFFLWWREAS